MARILIVDDDEDLLTGQRMYLEAKGHTVDTASTMEAALDMIAAAKPDLILADLMMEHYDTGFVFCKKAKSSPGMEAVPIIMQTAASRKLGFTFESSTPTDKAWTNVEEVLTKPVPYDQLLAKIQGYLNREEQ